jgi:hypothetical protein
MGVAWARVMAVVRRAQMRTLGRTRRQGSIGNSGKDRRGEVELMIADRD